MSLAPSLTPLAIGSSSSSTSARCPPSVAEELAAEAVEAGAPAVAAVPPTYYQPDFISVRRYYERLADAAGDTPLLAYNNPSATGYDLRPEQAAELHRDGVIAGVKQATTSVKDLHALIDAGVPVWMANSGLNTAALAMGARGAISTLTNVVPELFVRLQRAMRDGGPGRGPGRAAPHRSRQRQACGCRSSARSTPVPRLRGLPGGHAPRAAAPARRRTSSTVCAVLIDQLGDG